MCYHRSQLQTNYYISRREWLSGSDITYQLVQEGEDREFIISLDYLATVFFFVFF